MPRTKPFGCPRYMVEKRLRRGVGYFYSPPTWARKAGCPCVAEALGSDYGAAKKRVDEILNPAFDDWRRGGVGPIHSRIVVGTFDWMVGRFKTTPKFLKASERHRKATEGYLTRVADYRLSDGRRLGEIGIKSVTPGVADKIVDKLATDKDGKFQGRTATAIATACRTAWNGAWRDSPTLVPMPNPFGRMGIEYRAKRTRPVTHDALLRFVQAADDAGEPSIGTAAMVSYYFMMRQVDVLTWFSWSHYRPKDRPTIVQVRHRKTGEEIDVPLFDEDGTALWPEIMSRLDGAPRRGTLVVTRDKQDRRKKMHLPWKEDNFRHRVAEIREAAGLDADLKFMGLRHGGSTDAADADLTDAQLRALSGHRTADVILRYAQGTEKQRIAGARKLRNARTKQGGLSE